MKASFIPGVLPFLLVALLCVAPDANAMARGVTEETIKLESTGVQSNPRPAGVVYPSTAGLARVRIEYFDNIKIEEDFSVQVASLNPGTYRIRVNGDVIVYTFVTDSTGAASVMLRDNAVPLQIQPVTLIRLVEVIDSAHRPVLKGSFAGAAPAGNPTAVAVAQLIPSEKYIRGTAQFIVRPIGNAVEQLLVIELWNMHWTPQPYMVRVNGTAIGAIVVNHVARGKIAFMTNPGRHEVDLEMPLNSRFTDITQLRTIEIFDFDSKTVFFRGRFKLVSP